MLMHAAELFLSFSNNSVLSWREKDTEREKEKEKNEGKKE